MNKYIKLIIGLSFSVIGLYYAFKGVNFTELTEYFSRVKSVYILLSMAVMIISVAVRALRWKFIMEPIDTFSFRPLYSATMIGYFGNSVLPFRLGELLRAYAVSISENITTSMAFGTIILERLLDMIGLAALMILFAFISPLMGWSNNLLIVLVVLTVGGLIFIIWLGKSHSRFHEILIHWKLFESRTGQRLLEIFNNLFKGLTSIRQTKHTFPLIVFTILLWFLYYICIYLVGIATGIDINWVGIGILLITTTLAITIPSAPGFVGTYHAAAVYVLVNLFHVGLTESQAFAVLIHAIGFIPLVIIGFLYFLKSSIHFSDVKVENISP